MSFLVRKQGGDWRQPTATAYPDEATLQVLLADSPDLLPVDEPVLVVSEFSVPNIGSADLVGITASGGVVIVECKLRANPQIRREVVGQALAYAGGIWRMDADRFVRQFEAKAGVSLAEVAQELGGSSAADVREAVESTLEHGNFRVVIAVDEITPELRTIVEFVNAHTSELEFVALELGYSREDEIEIIVPTVYGAEVAEAKRPAGSSGRRRWTLGDVEDSFDQQEFAELKPIVGALVRHAREHSVKLNPGSGSNPAVACYYAVEGTPTSCWALHVNESDPTIVLSLGAIQARSQQHAAAFLEKLKELPGFESVTDFGPNDLAKYPSVRLDGLGMEGAAALLAAVDELRDH